MPPLPPPHAAMSSDDHENHPPRTSRTGPFFRNPLFEPPRRHQYDLNKIMLTAIIALSVVVVLVIVLHIYARYVLRR
ncbi:hypothetical protein RHMOL_Rhmol06G0190400 [Rhododendron molle]|uniref:Uncharacterized protein n=1 Tax=Rhododendron molle TaxID=49168 RepID=A0ACC0NEH5_RHOML|nr:hypothetical protein RHMOL_Rhmol06G0190400 [Rhododendron molle]